MATASLVLSILAVLVAGFSGWSAHRSARSSESSARSAAEALELDRDRRHEERTPQLRLFYDRQVGNSEALWLLNNSRESYQVRLGLLPREEGGPVETLHVATRSGGVAVVREGEEIDVERPLEIGGKELLRFNRTPSLRAGIVRLRVTCSNKHGEWPVPVEAKIPARVPEGQRRHEV